MQVLHLIFKCNNKDNFEPIKLLIEKGKGVKNIR